MKKTLRVSSAVLLAATALDSSAAIYNEAINGDLGSSSVINLDTGLNTISGSTTLHPPFGSDFDEFIFTIPDSTKIENVTYSFNLTSNTGGRTLVNYVTNLQEYQPNVVTDVGDNKVYIDIASGSGLKNIDITYLANVDTYRWSHRFQHLAAESGDVYWDYTTSITVSAVPVPAAVWLFGSGLLGLIGIARKKRA